VKKQYTLMGLTLAFTGMMLVPDLAMAGVGGTALNTVWTTIVDLTQGTLGRIITLLIVVGGIAAAVVKQSLWAFIIGLSAGIGLYNAPTIINTLVAGVL
jgi:conjugal transfer pilus assembly protein TraA